MAIMRDEKQEKEWRNAQEMKVSLDLLSGTKQHLKFLDAVDRNGSWLCEDGPLLQRAIKRYTTCWIPLLAKHAEQPLFEGPLVAPLDCEWVWHCHRLNPITYKSDCQTLYGKILDNKNVVSTTQGTSEKETEDVWKKLYPNEPFLLDPSVTENDNNENVTEAGKLTKYDLTSAVLRQSSFISQIICEPHMNNHIYLEGAVARYKGFLHLVKRNTETGMRNFLAPTYDIDLVWHTHQLHPVTYCNDLENLLGWVMGHDDSVSNRNKGQKLDVGFTRTINGWADMYGSRYRRAGAMHKFSPPSPSSNKTSTNSDEKTKQVLPELKIMDVMLEFVNVKDMPEEHEGKQLFVSFSKTQPDALLMGKRMIAMMSEFEEPIARFQCQPSGKFVFELVVCSPSSEEVSQPTQTLGSCSISVEDLLLPESGFIMEKWLELIPSSDYQSAKPISIRMAISVTPPTPAPLSLKLVRLAACLCNIACTGPFCDMANSSKPVVTDSSASSCVTNCVGITKAGACDSSPCVGNCVAVSKAGTCDSSPCVGNCVAVSKAGACDSSPCMVKCVSVFNAGACDASPCVGNCMAVSKPGACDASPCIANCVVASKAGACDASPCVRNCVVASKAGACDASPCIANCVVASKAGACDASPCVGNCVVASKAGACDASPCVGNCVVVSKAGASDASPCIADCVVASKAGACDTSPRVGNCVAVSKAGACDASPCVGNCVVSKAGAVASDANSCEVKACPSGIPCA